MKVEAKSIDEIKPYENNPRDNDDAVDAVANSIKEFGWQQPIVVDNEGVIIAGHTRYKAAKKLGLKHVPVVVAENVEGLLRGNAKGYVNLIIKKFHDAGYKVQLFLLNAATMGVPQRRKRSFFICTREDLDLPDIKLNFHEKPITYGEFKDNHYKPMNKNTLFYKRWLKRIPKDRNIGDTVKRTENGKISMFSFTFCKDSEVPNTLTASNNPVRFDVPGFISDKDMITIQTFPQDYDFNDMSANYVCGMSVPPVMMKKIAIEIKKQLLDKVSAR